MTPSRRRQHAFSVCGQPNRSLNRARPAPHGTARTRLQVDAGRTCLACCVGKEAHGLCSPPWIRGVAIPLDIRGGYLVDAADSASLARVCLVIDVEIKHRCTFEILEPACTAILPVLSETGRCAVEELILSIGGLARAVISHRPPPTMWQHAQRLEQTS